MGRVLHRLPDGFRYCGQLTSISNRVKKNPPPPFDTVVLPGRREFYGFYRNDVLRSDVITRVCDDLLVKRSVRVCRCSLPFGNRFELLG